jgi:hypothetical protein
MLISRYPIGANEEWIEEMSHCPMPPPGWEYRNIFISGNDKCSSNMQIEIKAIMRKEKKKEATKKAMKKKGKKSRKKRKQSRMKIKLK